ncbi:MAG: DUF4294 domain-containing protein [Dysgonomonas sp.]|nr:DUF4294 domain-containing protein [Dysgonomonas sp.]
MPVNKKYIYLSAFFLLLCIGQASAQFERKIKYTFRVTGVDTTFHAYIPEVTVFTPLKFKNEKEKLEYTKLVRDVKKTLPYANQVAVSIIETYEFMSTLPNDKARQKHMEEAQKYIMNEYKPKMKKLTKNQGKILVKLIDRQTNSSAYDIVKSLVGGFKATMYNTFAGLFGNSLKTQYDPDGKDKMIERIVIEVEQGSL